MKIAIAFVLLTASLFADDDPFKEVFFPPELVIQNQEALQLTDDQKTYLRNELRQAQSTFTDLQWKMQDEVEKMSQIVRQHPADEQKALAELDKVLSIERDIKRAQVQVMLRIRNNLKPEQLAKVKELKNKAAK